MTKKLKGLHFLRVVQRKKTPLKKPLPRQKAL